MEGWVPDLMTCSMVMMYSSKSADSSVATSLVLYTVDGGTGRAAGLVGHGVLASRGTLTTRAPPPSLSLPRNTHNQAIPQPFSDFRT